MKNKRNLNTKWLLLQNNQNADTTLLHSHDELYLYIVIISRLVVPTWLTYTCWQTALMSILSDHQIPIPYKIIIHAMCYDLRGRLHFGYIHCTEPQVYLRF